MPVTIRASKQSEEKDKANEHTTGGELNGRIGAMGQ